VLLPEALIEAGAIGAKPPDDPGPAGGLGPAAGATVCGCVGAPENDGSALLAALPFTEFAGVKIAD